MYSCTSDIEKHRAALKDAIKRKDKDAEKFHRVNLERHEDKELEDEQRTKED